MLQELNITKRQVILTAVLIATFMVPFVTNISTADVNAGTSLVELLQEMDEREAEHEE